MTEKELKKLNRKQLLELLLVQAARVEELEIELEEARKMLKAKEILITEAGTMAEAALKINGVFEAVDAAAAQYLQNIKRINKLLEQRAALTDKAIDGTTSFEGPGWMNLLLDDTDYGAADEE